jgi:hypothetical protein
VTWDAVVVVAAPAGAAAPTEKTLPAEIATAERVSARDLGRYIGIPPRERSPKAEFVHGRT